LAKAGRDQACTSTSTRMPCVHNGWAPQRAAARQRRREARAEPPEHAARAADAGDGVAL
jgi:hypothetical protein